MIARPKSWKDLIEVPEHKIAVVSKMTDIARKPEGTTIVFRASTMVKDRDGEQITPMGWSWRDHLPNQLYNHDPKVSENWIGKGARVWKDEDALYYETVLFDNSPSSKGELARQIAWIAQDHPECLSCSVGFTPLKWRDPNGQTFTFADPKGSPPWSTPGRTYLEQELLENSVAPVESNFEAIAVQVRSLFAGEPAKEAPADLSPVESFDKMLHEGTLTTDALIARAAEAGVVLEELDPEWFQLGIRKAISRPQLKVGAVLSRANIDRLMAAKAGMTQACEHIDAMVATAKPAEDDASQ